MTSLYTPPQLKPSCRATGEQLVREGKVGCLLLAGGQGTRLGLSGPKGILPVTAIRHHSLFQLAAEKIAAASAWAGRQLPLCVMTSPLNHDDTRAYFDAHCPPCQLSMIQQQMLPCTDAEGGPLFEAPDGNGRALQLLRTSGVALDWQRQGIEYVTIVFVDNLLADPFQFEWIGHTHEGAHDLVLISVVRERPEEQMGLLVEREGTLAVIEYSELQGLPPAGAFSSTGMFCAKMELINTDYELPLHTVRKVHQGQEIIKREYFLFDLLEVARSSSACVLKREEIYAPIKRAEDLAPAQKALLREDHRRYLALTGRKAPVARFELDPAFYYPRDNAAERLRAQELHEGQYIKY